MKLRELIIKKYVMQVKFAKALGVSQPYVSQVLSGARPASLSLVKMISKKISKSESWVIKQLKRR